MYTTKLLTFRIRYTKKSLFPPTQLKTSEADFFIVHIQTNRFLNVFFLPVIKLMTKGNPVLFN